MRQNITILCFFLFHSVQYGVNVSGQKDPATTASADIVALEGDDVIDQDGESPVEGAELILDATNLGTGRDFYSRPSISLQIGDKIKVFQRVLGDASNNNNFVGESTTGDTLQLLRYTSAVTGKEILIGSLVELDTKLVYQFRSEPHPSGSNSEKDRTAAPQQRILLKSRVTPSHEIPPSGEPFELDRETIQQLEEFHKESMKPGYEFQTAIPEDDNDNSTLGTMSSAKANSYGENIDIISLMVPWSKQAECMYSFSEQECELTQDSEDRMRALIDAAVAETNAAYKLSDIDVQFELVYAYRHPTYKESEALDAEIPIAPNGVFANTLGRLAIPLDGILDDVQPKRRKYYADMVAMIIDDDTYCGVAFIGTGLFPSPSAPFMYSVNGFNCATGTFTVAHELGHNFGCAHDRGTLDQCGPIWWYYAHGWRDPKCNFRTVMAYDCEENQCDNQQCSGCPTIARFSRADATYQGLPLGNKRNDCARHIRKTAPRVARFYDAEDLCGPDDTSCQIEALLCFAPDTTVMVEGIGDVAMKDVKVGDRILTAEDGEGKTIQYEKIYSIDHYHKSQPTQFLQIITEAEQPLEISAHHMIFVEGLSHPIPASNLKVGQFLHSLSINGTIASNTYTRITNITTVVRKGFYNVLTGSGTVIANGVVASTYASLQITEKSESRFLSRVFTLKDGYISYKTWGIISQQQFLHMLLAPYRAALLVKLCFVKVTNSGDDDDGDDDDDGREEEFHSFYTRIGLHLLEWWENQCMVIQVIAILLFLLVFGILQILAWLLTAPMSLPFEHACVFLALLLAMPFL